MLHLHGLNNFQLEQLPYVELLNKEQLPETAGIYFVVDNEHNVWYIGKAQNLRARWIGHHRYDQISKINKKNSIKILWYKCNSDKNTLTELENYFIDTYHPVLNQTSVENRKVTPAEIELRNALVKIVKYIIVYGYEVNSKEFGLPTVYLKYDTIYWNPAKNLKRVFDAINKKGNLRWSYYWRVKHSPIWKTKCNGVCVVVGAWSQVNYFIQRGEVCTLAGVPLLNISEDDFQEEVMNNNGYQNTYHPELERYNQDTIPLLWTKNSDIGQLSIETLKDLSKQRTESKIGTYRPRGRKVRVVCTAIGWGIECIIETYEEAIEWFGGYEALGLQKTYDRSSSVRIFRPHKVTVKLPEMENGITKYRSMSAPISASTKEELMQRVENIRQLSPLHQRVARRIESGNGEAHEQGTKAFGQTDPEGRGLLPYVRCPTASFAIAESSVLNLQK